MARQRRENPKPTPPKSDDITFVDGVSVFAPHKNAPEFILATVSIEPRRLLDFIKENPQILTDYVDGKGKARKLVKMDLKESKGGNLYLALNSFVPEKGRSNEPKATEQDDDLPF